MLDINFVRENPDLVRKSEKKRGHDLKLVDEVIKTDLQWRRQLKAMEKLIGESYIACEE